jgi:solute carrier family 25 S-adenosylmethionine transporter 26
MDRVIVSGCAGGIAGIMVDLIYFPIETIKIRIQASNSKVDYIKSASSISKYKGVINFCNTVH